jgi:hypothetical protein
MSNENISISYSYLKKIAYCILNFLRLCLGLEISPDIAIESQPRALRRVSKLVPEITGLAERKISCSAFSHDMNSL